MWTTGQKERELKGLKQKLGMADGISCNGHSYGSTESVSLSVSREDLSDIDGLIWDRWKTEVGRKEILGCNYIVRASVDLNPLFSF